MQRNKVKESLLMFLLMATIVVVIDGVAFSEIVKPHGLAIAMIIHIFVVGALIAWVLYRTVRNKNHRFATLLLVMTAATGPFGAGVCLLTAVVSSYCVSRATHPTQWISSLFSQDDDDYEVVHERIIFGLDNINLKSGVEPFQDVMATGNMIQKQITIAKMTKYFRPQFAPLLIKATNDHNAAVRVQAAAALAKLEKGFMSEYMQLEKSLQDIPYFDPSWLKLAKIYEDYANSGLLDDYSLQGLQKKAIIIYESYLALLFNKDIEIQMRLARLYMQQGHPARASKLFSDSIKSLENAPLETVLLYIESLFSLQKFSELRQMAKHYVNEPVRIDDSSYAAEIKERLSLWIGENQMETINLKTA